MKIKKCFMPLLSIIILIVIDQLTKYLATQYLKIKDSIELIPEIFELNYTINKGAAFGILQDHQILFAGLTIVVLIAILFVYNKLPLEKRYFPLRISLVFLAAGAIGNLVDRIRLGFVVDFLYFKLINFPVFNVADCYVTVSAFLLVILLVFYYKEEDLELIMYKRKRV